MLTPVTCFSCGCPIGDVDDLFRHLRAARVRAALEAQDVAPDAAASARLQIDCCDLFGLLGIASDCCRMHLSTAIRFQDVY